MSQEIVRELEEIFGGKLEQVKGHVGSAWNLHGVPVYYEVEKSEDYIKPYFKDYVKYERDEGEICYICEDDYKKYDKEIRNLIEAYKEGNMSREEFRDELDGHNDYVGVDRGYIRVYAANRQEEVTNKIFRFYLHGEDCITARDEMIEEGMLVEENGKYFLLGNAPSLEVELYDIYRIEWIDENITKNVKEKTLERYLDYCENERADLTFTEYVEEFGYSTREMYASFEEFLDNELEDEEIREYYLEKLFEHQEKGVEKYQVILDTVSLGKRSEYCRSLSECRMAIISFRENHYLGASDMEKEFGDVYVGDELAFKIMYNGRVKDMRMDEPNVFLNVDNEIYYKLDDQLKEQEIENLKYKPFIAGDTKRVMEEKMEERNMSQYDGITVEDAYKVLLKDHFDGLGIELTDEKLEDLYLNTVQKTGESHYLNPVDLDACEKAIERENGKENDFVRE